MTTEIEKDEIRCGGCGILLQGDDPKAPGYVNKIPAEGENLVCRRCFRIKHYNEHAAPVLEADDFMRMIQPIRDKQALVVSIVDIFDFEGSLVSGLQRFAGDNPLILVINKIDLLPKGIKPSKLVHWAKHAAKQADVKVTEVVACSASKQINFDLLADALEHYRGGRDIYVIGATNVGKSTLINQLIREYSELSHELTTSPYPGTTLNLVRIPLADGSAIYDTPGIMYRHRLTELVEATELRKLIPARMLKPVGFQLNEKQTVFMGGYARFDFTRGERQSFTFYVSEQIKLHRTKLERADELYETQAGSLLTPPSQEQLADLPPLTRYTFQIPAGGGKDVSISGLGWIQCHSDKGAHIEIHVPRGIRVALRESLI